MRKQIIILHVLGSCGWQQNFLIFMWKSIFPVSLTLLAGRKIVFFNIKQTIIQAFLAPLTGKKISLFLSETYHFQFCSFYRLAKNLVIPMWKGILWRSYDHPCGRDQCWGLWPWLGRLWQSFRRLLLFLGAVTIIGTAETIDGASAPIVRGAVTIVVNVTIVWGLWPLLWLLWPFFGKAMIIFETVTI